MQNRIDLTQRVARPARTGLYETNRSRSRIIRRLPILLLLALGSAIGCSSTPIVGPPTAPPIQGYVVGPPDQLIILIMPEPEIIRNVRVRPDGKISVDLIGDVQASGRTPSQIAQTIQNEIGRYKRDAIVSVAVETSASQFVTIYGEVGSPGLFALETETRVSEAIGRVGGTRPFAKLSGVRIIRPKGASAELIEVRLDDIQDGDLSTNFVVEKGDLIVVPPTALARIGYAMQMLFFPFQPLLSGASTAGSVYSLSN